MQAARGKFSIWPKPLNILINSWAHKDIFLDINLNLQTFLQKPQQPSIMFTYSNANEPYFKHLHTWESMGLSIQALESIKPWRNERTRAGFCLLGRSRIISVADRILSVVSKTDGTVSVSCQDPVLFMSDIILSICETKRTGFCLFCVRSVRQKTDNILSMADPNRKEFCPCPFIPPRKQYQVDLVSNQKGH